MEVICTIMSFSAALSRLSTHLLWHGCFKKVHLKLYQTTTGIILCLSKNAVLYLDSWICWSMDISSMAIFTLLISAFKYFQVIFHFLSKEPASYLIWHKPNWNKLTSFPSVFTARRPVWSSALIPRHALAVWALPKKSQSSRFVWLEEQW